MTRVIAKNHQNLYCGAWEMRAGGNSTGAITLILADDHVMVRRALRRSFGRARQGIQVVGEADNGAQAILAAQDLRPTVVILDLFMPHGPPPYRTIELLSEVSAVVVLSGSAEAWHVVRALRASARGFVHKQSPFEQLEHAVCEVAAGRVSIDPKIAGEVAARLAQPTEAALSPRETDVLRALAQGLGDAEIACQLGVSAATVRTHVQNAMGKLGAHSRLKLVLAAVRSGYLGIEDLRASTDELRKLT